MPTPTTYQQKATEFRGQLIDVLEKFLEKNPDIPAQVLMGSIGELLIKFSMSQAGKAHTLRLISYLAEAVEHFEDTLSSRH